MILPADFDLERSDDELVVDLVDRAGYDEDTARAMVEILRDPDAEPLE